MQNISRPVYLERILPFLDKPVIKVITGMRRVGKSHILGQVRDSLLARGEDPRSIFMLNKESLEWDHVRTHIDLWHTIQAHFRGWHGPRRVFLDEVQEIGQWERAAASMLADGYADLVVSGSNAHMLSTELATLLAGRYVEFPILPLSFREFLAFRKTATGSREDEFRHYLRYGGLPGIHNLPLEDEPVFTYLNAIYSTIVLRDVVQRHALRDPAQLARIVRFVFDNCGNITTAKRISDFLKNQQLRVSHDKVLAYLGYLEQAHLVHKVTRFDIKGLRNLELYEKYYPGDIGLRHGFLGYRDQDIGGILEHVVYQELRHRGYRVMIGKWEEREVDFVAETGNERLYVQVTTTLAGREVIEREYAALEKIPDNHPKLVLSMDADGTLLRGGIRQRNLMAFLLEG